MKAESEIEILKEFIHENAELERLEDIVDEFNIFTALSVVNNELRHSNFLSWLMNPNESHGLGDYFLTSFLKSASFKASALGVPGPSIFDIDGWHFDDAEILREWRNIDIFVKCEDQKFVCVVENKIHSKEHSQQLLRYKCIVKKNYPKYKKLFVYLTIEGDNPTDEDYLPLSYSDVVSLIEHLINSKKDKLSPEILAFISHYKEMLRRYIVENSDVQEICRKIYKSHKKALDLIFEYRPDRILEISSCLVDIINKYAPELILDHSSKSFVHFIPKSLDDLISEKGTGWTKTGRILLFQITLRPGKVNLHLVIGPGPQEIREKLYAIAKGNPDVFKVSKSKFTKQWSRIYRKPLLSSKEYEDKEIEEIRELLEEKLQKFKDSDLPKIEDEIKKFWVS